MDLEKLKSNWKKGKQLIGENYKLNHNEMESVIKNQSNDTTKRLSRIFLMGITVQSLTIVLMVINMITYRQFSDLTLLTGVSLILVVLALSFSINRFRVLNAADYGKMSLAETLKKKITFYKYSYNKWLLSYAFSFVFFMWSINMLIGDITSISAFNSQLLLVYTACFLIIFFSYRYAHTRYLREYEICLNDLGGKQLTDLKQEGLKFKRFKFVLIAVFSILLLIGILLFIFR